MKKFEDGSSVKGYLFEKRVGKPGAGKTEFVFLRVKWDEILNLPNDEKAKKLGLTKSQLDGELARIDFKSTYK